MARATILFLLPSGRLGKRLQTRSLDLTKNTLKCDHLSASGKKPRQHPYAHGTFTRFLIEACMKREGENNAAEISCSEAAPPMERTRSPRISLEAGFPDRCALPKAAEGIAQGEDGSRHVGSNLVSERLDDPHALCSSLVSGLAVVPRHESPLTMEDIGQMRRDACLSASTEEDAVSWQADITVAYGLFVRHVLRYRGLTGGDRNPRCTQEHTS